MKGIPIQHKTDAELEALYRAEQAAYHRGWRRRRAAIARFREQVGAAITLLPGMPIRAEELLSEAVNQFDKEMNDGMDAQSG